MSTDVGPPFCVNVEETAGENQERQCTDDKITVPVSFVVWNRTMELFSICDSMPIRRVPEFPGLSRFTGFICPGAAHLEEEHL